ncbi:MAG: ABC transporter ATP-binding protein [Clostridia bacterium]|nr:ABC transporter ATP-binding protein [Clostridia bacterium]
MENIISLRNAVVDYDGDTILKGISLDIVDKQFVTLLGPSGCGKTTTLRIIGGFLQMNSGELYFDGKKINDLPAYKRNINTVFQKYALFPHLNVYENIAFGLRLKKMSESEIKENVTEMLRLVNLSGYERRSINSLSGGQQQRVGIARALVNKPRVLLLDEPLGALDLKLRKEMQIELKKIHKRLGITFIYVTHDQEEALTMSDTVVVMNHGEIQQIGTPEDIYNEPVNAFVADFIGESNIIDGIMHADYFVEIGGVVFECEDAGFGTDKLVDVVIRPEDIKVVAPCKEAIVGVVKDVIFKGVHFEILVETDNFLWKIHSTKSQPIGARIGMTLQPNDIHIMHKLRE